MPDNAHVDNGGTNDWRFWIVIAVVLIVSAATLLANRYTFQCTASHPAAGIRQFSAVHCNVLDRWTGEVRTVGEER